MMMMMIIIMMNVGVLVVVINSDRSTDMGGKKAQKRRKEGKTQPDFCLLLTRTCASMTFVCIVIHLSAAWYSVPTI